MHIQKEDGTILPATKGKNFKGVSLKVRLTGGGQCPKLVVEATHEKPGKLTRQPNHRAELVFNLGTTSDHEHSQITDIHVIEEAGITFSETKKEDKPQDNDGGNASDREKRYLRIQFKTRGGLGFNLDRQDPAFDPETVQTLAFLQDHEYRKLNENPLSTSPCVRTVHLVVEMSAMHRQTPDFLKYLNNFTVPLSFPWQAYRHQKGGLNIQIGQMFSRDMVSQNWSVLPKSDPILVVSPQGDPVAIFNARDEAHAEDVKEEVHVEDEAQVEVEGLVHPNTVVGIPEIPAKAYFVDAIEGATALGYGIAIDQRLADINYERLQHTPHKVAFTPVGSAVQAHLIFRHLFEEGARPRLPEGTFVKIVFRIQGEEKTQKVTAFTISSALGQARGNVLLLVIGRPLMYFTENGLASTDDTKWIECNLQVRSDMGALKRMVSSLEEFKRNDVAKKFLPVFLNQRPRDLPPTCPFEDLDKDLITRKKNAILGRQNVNDEQRRAFNQLFQMHGHFALCQGIPGSGKTRQIAMMIAFVLSLGLPVLACASTNQATDHLAEVVAKYLKDSGDAALKAIKPVRVYRPMQERNAADKTTSKEDAGEEAAEDDDDIAEMDADHILYNVLSQLKADVSRKNFNHAAFSLQARTNEYATEAEGREQLWSNYKGFPDRDPEVRLYNADTGAVEKSIESGDREGSEMLDMLEVIRDSTARLQGEPLEKWAKDDQNKRRRALNVGGHHVIGKAQLVFSTTNGVAGPFIKEKFGEKAQGIFVFVDEASQDPEPNTWTFLKLAQLEKVKGIYLVGDQEQLKPAVFSATASPRINEFAPQLTMSLFTRLITSGFPSCKLFTQFRAHPDLMHYPNMRTYNNTVTNGPGAKGLILDRQWQKSTREFLSVPQRMLTVFVIDVTDSFCEKYPGTKTRYNPNHVNVGVAYIKKLYEDGCLEKHSMLIVTPYQGQRSRYTEQLARLSMDKGIPMSRLPTVHTARTMQGREADVIIYDSVLSSVESIAELGIQRDEGLMNVAHTRARRGFVGICSDQITRGTLSDKWPAKKDLEGRGSKVHNPKPYLIDMVNYYARQGKLFHLAGQNYAIEN